MAVFRRGGIWWYEFQFRGVRIRQSYSGIKAVAQRIERERHRSLELSVVGIEEIRRPLMFSRVATEWGQDNPHWSESTRKISAQQLGRLVPVFGKMLIADIKPSDVAAYQRKRQREEAPWPDNQH